MQRRLWLLVGAAAATMVLAISASATTKSWSSAQRPRRCAVLAVVGERSAGRPAGRKAKSVLVFGDEQDVAGFNRPPGDAVAYWAALTGTLPSLRGTYIIDKKATTTSTSRRRLPPRRRPDDHHPPGCVLELGWQEAPGHGQDFVYTWKQIVNPATRRASTTGYDQITGYTIKGAKRSSSTGSEAVRGLPRSLRPHLPVEGACRARLEHAVGELRLR